PIYAEQVEGHRRREFGEQVGSGDPAAAQRVVDDHAGAGHVGGVAVAGVDDAVLDDRDGGPPAVPEQPVEVGDVHDGDVGAVVQEVAAVGDDILGEADVGGGPAGGVVLDVDGGHVASRPPPEPLLGEPQLVGPLQDDDVDVLVTQPLGGDLDRAVGPVEGVGPPPPVRAAAGGDGDERGLRPVDERRRPRAVTVPHQHSHRAGTSSSATISTASATRPVSARDSQWWPTPGRSRARLSLHAAVWSPSSAVGTPNGAQRTAGTVGANSDTTGVPTAAARCAGPVLPATRAHAPASTDASSGRDVRPPRSRPSSPATAAVSSCSSRWPVTTTRRPAARSSRTASAQRSGGQARAGTEAPGCTTT